MLWAPVILRRFLPIDHDRDYDYDYDHRGGLVVPPPTAPPRLRVNCTSIPASQQRWGCIIVHPATTTTRRKTHTRRRTRRSLIVVVRLRPLNNTTISH